jgi:hypothetical protein
MDKFDIMISMINYLLYVIIIMVIYGINMTWKLPIFLTYLTCLARIHMFSLSYRCQIVIVASHPTLQRHRSN